jgi:hypothetical protein
MLWAARTGGKQLMATLKAVTTCHARPFALALAAKVSAVRPRSDSQ